MQGAAEKIRDLEGQMVRVKTAIEEVNESLSELAEKNEIVSDALEKLNKSLEEPPEHSITSEEQHRIPGRR